MCAAEPTRSTRRALPGIAPRPQSDRLLWLGLAALIVLPRYYLWGTAPAGIHGDEGGFAAVGLQMLAAPSPLWSFGPQSLPNAHFWLYGAGMQLLGPSIWSARLVTSLFGVLQAFAVVDIARRTAGRAAAVSAAIVMAIPLQLHFDRLAMCNVITTATWSLALWFVVAIPRRVAAALLAGMLLALGWYGYQSSRIAPLIAAAGLLPLLTAPRTRWPALGLAAVGLLGFAIVIAPLVYGFYQAPTTLFGRASGTSWLPLSADPWTALATHLNATGAAMLGTEVDVSGGFFPFLLPLIPIGLIAFALVGLVACPLPALRWCLVAWIGLVLGGNVMRTLLVYSPVLICLVPAVALAAACSARWLRWLAPLGVALVCAQPIYRYFEAAVRIPPGEMIPMAQAQLLHDMDEIPTVVIAGGVGCGHGLTAFALGGRTCLAANEIARVDQGAPRLYVLYPPFFALEDSLSADPALIRSERIWGVTPVHIWSSVPLAN